MAVPVTPMKVGTAPAAVTRPSKLSPSCPAVSRLGASADSMLRMELALVDPWVNFWNPGNAATAIPATAAKINSTTISSTRVKPALLACLRLTAGREKVFFMVSTFLIVGVVRLVTIISLREQF